MPESIDSHNDSIAIAADSVVEAAASTPRVLPWEVCRDEEAPLPEAQHAMYVSVATDYNMGLDPAPITQRLATNSGLLTIMSLIFVLLAFNVRYCVQLFAVLGQELLSVRRRANAFDEPTANENRVIVVLLLTLWVCEGILFYIGLVSQGLFAPGPLFAPIGAMMLVAVGFYLFQLVAYNVVGFAFTDEIGRSQWVKGFNTSQAFLGGLLLIPTVVAIFYPSWTAEMIWISVGFYVLARIVFIFKGFRIFYHNFQSLLYFILYLCALEIVPVVLVGTAAIFLAQQIQ